MSIAPKYIPVYWAPDQDPSWTANPGVLSYVGNMVPTTRGTLANWVSTASENVDTFGATAPVSADLPRTATVMRRSSAATDRRYFVGTDNRLLEFVGTPGGAGTDVSRTAGGPYSATEWTFDAYGDMMIATCAKPASNAQPTEYPQYSQGAAGTAFANMVTGSPPKARLCVVQNNFLLLFDVYDGSNWYQDGWCCSGLGNTGSWATTVADLTTGANNGRLLATPGPIRAAVKQRDTVVVYKANSMYVMTYTGNPYTWSTRLISDKVGQLSSGGVAVVNGVHYFCNRGGVFRFDGSYPQNIGTGIVNEFLSRLNPTASQHELPGLKAAVSEDHQLIVWYWPTKYLAQYGDTTSDCALAYNYATGKFGFVDKIWDDQVPAPGTTLFGCPLVGTRNDLGATFENPLYPFVNFGYSGGNIICRGVNIGKGSQTGNTVCSIETGDIGDEYANTRLTRIKPRLVSGDGDLQAATVYVDGKASQGDYYQGNGILTTAVASGAGAAGIGPPMREYIFPTRPTIAAGDYITFDLYPVAGDPATLVGVKLLFGDFSTGSYTGTLTPTGAWKTVSASLAIPVGKTLALVYSQIDSTGAAGTQSWYIRNVRITDSAGVLRRRICFSGEELASAHLDIPAVGTLAAGTVEYSRSKGTAFTYDSTRRRFDGNVSNRWLRARMNLYNKTDLAALYLETQQAGSE